MSASNNKQVSRYKGSGPGRHLPNRLEVEPRRLLKGREEGPFLVVIEEILEACDEAPQRICGAGQVLGGNTRPRRITVTSKTNG